MGMSREEKKTLFNEFQQQLINEMFGLGNV
jgi:hypothetical protein